MQCAPFTLVSGMEVRLTASEERIFQVLLAAVEHCNIGTQLRVAGGWVRDKLLGLSSHDIDIALDNRTGKKFREEILGYLNNIGALTGKLKDVKTSEASKELETSFIEIYGQPIDLANLRKETYTTSSRRPKVEKGTPIEDAYRRDLTINSLFYNLSTRCVEDFTGSGIADLNAGIIRTTCPPLDMFLDDPLRIFRAVRFGCRFGFELDQELKEAASAPQVHLAVCTKLKKGLIVEEGKKIIFGKDPQRAMRLLREVGCLNHLLSMPKYAVVPDNWESLGVDVSALIDALELSDENVKSVVALASFLLPLKDYTYTHRDKTIPLSTHVVKDCLLYNDNVATEVASLLAAVRNPHMNSWFDSSKPELANSNPVQFEGDARVQVGLLLNDLLVLKGARNSFKENSVEALVALMTAYKCASENERGPVCKAFRAAIQNSGLYKLNCFLDGKHIIKALGSKNGGNQIGVWLRRALVWQLENRGASASDCEEWLSSWTDSNCDKRGYKRGATSMEVKV